MKKLLAGILSLALLHFSFAWGFLGHETINNRAVYALPPELFGFYKKHMDYVTQHAVDPDNRRYLFDNEGCRHFIDCDRYEFAAPMDTVPHNWFKAVEKYSEDSLKEHGIVPWHTVLLLKQLTKAFEEHNLQKILKLSADIGHYIADAHVPLHTTGNYNGQRTHQEGIHALWESRIPQLFLDSFDLLNGTVNYVENPQEYIWNVVSESYTCVDSVLRLEQQISQLHENNKYSFEAVGNATQKVYSAAFCSDLQAAMDGMVERRMRKAIYSVAAFWYTAWVDAGQPDMGKITGIPITDALDLTAAKAKENGKIKGREENGKE